MTTQTQITKQQAAIIRNHVRDTHQRATISIGRSCNAASAGTGTPIEVVEGDQAPTLCGQPYLKTTFRRGSFSKTLYTPSTLFIEVGAGWIEAQS